MTSEHRKYLKEFSRCELCGSPKTLELHHIIPTAFGGPDVIDNWIAICRGCHAKLTPKNLLVRKGIADCCDPVYDFYHQLNNDYEYAKRTGEICGVNEAGHVLDVFDAVFNNPQNPVKAKYTCQKYTIRR